MKPADLDALRVLAEDAQNTHPGPWEAVWTYDRKNGRVDRIVSAPTDPQPDWLTGGEVHRQDVLVADSGVYPPRGHLAEYITAMSPDVTLKLLAVVRSLVADINDPDGDTGVSGATWDALEAIGVKP